MSQDIGNYFEKAPVIWAENLSFIEVSLALELVCEH